jgi:hypothetical protein
LNKDRGNSNHLLIAGESRQGIKAKKLGISLSQEKILALKIYI